MTSPSATLKLGTRSCSFHSSDEGFCEEADERNSKKKKEGKKHDILWGRKK